MAIFLLQQLIQDPENQIYQSGEYIGTILYIVALLAAGAAILSQKKPKLASNDDAVQSSATQGAYIPLVIGRARPGPVFCFVEDVSEETAALFFAARSQANAWTSAVGRAVGFAKGGGGAGIPTSYRENALHVICVGPASELIAIYQNGEAIWRGPITPASHPSGTLLAAGQNGSEGYFEVHWGFPDDPLLDRLRDNTKRHGLEVNYAFAFKIFWRFKDLGQSRNWPRLEYELRCPCYSQITSTPSEVPLEGDDKRPTFEEWLALEPSIAYVNSGYVNEDRVIFQVRGLNSNTRTIQIIDADLPGQVPNFTGLYASGGIIKILSKNISTQASLSAPVGFTDLVSDILPANNEWRYFWIIRSSYVDTSGPGSYTEVVLGPEIPFAEIKNRVSALPTFVPAPIEFPSGSGNFTGWTTVAEPVWTGSSDGINAIHMVDQLLFAKYPYGAGRDRERWFDPRAIEVAAEQMQLEGIRCSLMISDGEGVESVLSSIMQDIGLFIPWDVQVGKYVFRLLRYEESSAVLPPEAVLELPTMEAILGQRPADVVAFTFKNRERNYRDTPLRVTDSGQVAEYETQKARKVPIEVTCDPDSAARLAPRRQQEVLANLATITFDTNHGTQMATPGERFTAPAVEGEGIQFLITEVQRDINSSKVVLDTILDTYNPPEPGALLVPSFLSAPPMLQASQGVRIVDPLEDFQAFEVPRGLSSGQIQVLFAGARKSSRTLGAAIWGSRDGTAFTVLGQGPILAYGLLSVDLPAGSPAYDEASYDVEVPFAADLQAVLNLALDEDRWRAGQQCLLIDDEVIFLRSLLDGPFQISGLIRGRAGTIQAAHSAGTPFYIIPTAMAVPLESTLFAPGLPVYYKASAVERSKSADVGAVEEKMLTIQGLAFTPPPITGLRTPGLRTDYDAAEDVRLDWCYFSDEFKLTGLGSQPFGLLTGHSAPRGFFRVEIVGIKEFQVSDPFIVLDVATRSGLGLDLISSWQVRVTHVEGSFSSTPVTITLSPA